MNLLIRAVPCLSVSQLSILPQNPGQGCGGLETKFSLGQVATGPAEAQNHLAPGSK